MLVDETNVDHAIEQLKRDRIHAVTKQSPASITSDPKTVDTGQSLAMPQWLAGGINMGGLPRGAVTSMANCPAVVIDMLAHVTAAGGCAAVVGYPNLALAAVAAAGGELSRLIIVPDPQPHAAAVLSTLAEGVDMVVFVPMNPVTPTFARPVEARLRKSKCALISCGMAWPGARLNLDIRVTGVGGLGWGSGRVRTVDVAGKLWGKGQPPRTVTGQLSGERGMPHATEYSSTVVDLSTQNHNLQHSDHHEPDQQAVL